MDRVVARIVLVACSLGFAFPASGADLIDWLPAEVNAALSVRVADIYSSPLAKREAWATQSRDAYVAKDSVIPPGLKELTFGAELNLAGDLEPIRTYAVVAPIPGVTLEAIAALGGGTSFTVDSHAALETPRGAVVVQAQPSVWLGIKPGGRQAAARWMRSGSTTSNLKTLREALSQRPPKAQIALAIDLTDAVSPDIVDAFLSGLPDAPAAAQKTKVISILATPRYVLWTATIGEAISGEMHFEFAGATSGLAPQVKSLVPALLQQFGMADESMVDWTWSTKGNAVIGSGPLTAAQTRRLMSLVQSATPELAASASSASSATPASPADRAVSASKRYLTSVRTILDDLQGTLKKTRDNHALWYERSAGKLDDLPLMNVDPELLDYGLKVSNSLRYQAQAQRMANVRAGTVKAQTGAGNMSRYGYVGPYGGYAVSRETDVNPGAIDATANAAARDVRFSEWKQIEDGYGQIRRRLTEKLMAEF
jgi:hypothetical protein